MHILLCVMTQLRRAAQRVTPAVSRRDTPKTVTAPETAVLAVLTVGAAARLTRLITSDTITEPLRDRVLYEPQQRTAIAADEDMPAPHNPDRARKRNALHEFLECPWCVGMWTSAAVVAAAATIGHTRTFRIAAGTLATSYAVGFLAAAED